MEFEALEDEANAIHGDLWEQLNAGGQVKVKIESSINMYNNVMEKHHFNMV